MLLKASGYKKLYSKVTKSVVLAIKAVQTFSNFPAYFLALGKAGRGKTILRTRDGLSITIRNNIWDVRIVQEMFLEQPYMKYLSLPESPTIVDIGAYIGDFCVYAAKHLNARVIAYEPTQENFAILKENVENNSLKDKIELVNKAVGYSGEMTLNVQKNDEEIHVSNYWYHDGEKRSVQSVNLEEIFNTHSLTEVDLLKVDCEGGEYDIFPTVPEHLFAHIKNIVFEYHIIDNYQEKLASITSKLTGLGYVVKRHGMIVYAYQS